MPHLDIPLPLNPGAAVTPIAGNVEEAGMAADGNGEALYAVYANDPTHGLGFHVYRTRAGYLTLITENDSVDYLATIRSGQHNDSRNAGLTWIGGTLYAQISGVDVTGVVAGTWIYRDTGGGGQGPWVLHGTVDVQSTASAADAPSPVVRFAPHARWGGEILVMPSGRWFVACHDYRTGDVGGNIRVLHYWQIRYSDDDGVNWSTLVSPELGLGINFSMGSNSWAYFNGKWYASVRRPGSASSRHYYTSDGWSWTQYDPGVSGNNTPVFTFSTTGRIWRQPASHTLEYTETDPESGAVWTPVFSLTTYGMTPDPVSNTASAHYADIGPGGYPFLAAQAYGEVLGLGGTEYTPPAAPTLPRLTIPYRRLGDEFHDRF